MQRNNNKSKSKTRRQRQQQKLHNLSKQIVAGREKERERVGLNGEGEECSLSHA